MTGEEVRKMTDDEITQELERQRRRLFDLRTQSVTEKVDDSTLFPETKRDIARLLTEQRARVLANEPNRPMKHMTRRERRAAAQEAQA